MAFLYYVNFSEMMLSQSSQVQASRVNIYSLIISKKKIAKPIDGHGGLYKNGSYRSILECSYLNA